MYITHLYTCIFMIFQRHKELLVMINGEGWSTDVDIIMQKGDRDIFVYSPDPSVQVSS